MFRLRPRKKPEEGEEGEPRARPPPKGERPPLTATTSVRSRLLQQELSELDDGILPDTCKLKFQDVDNLRTFTLTITPDTGFWSGGKFEFLFEVPTTYNIEPPKVKAITKLWHPNIDLEGNVCLNILRADWTPVLTLKHVCFGIHELFESLVNPDDPLNIEAAQQLSSDPEGFERKAKEWTRKHAK